MSSTLTLLNLPHIVAVKTLVQEQLKPGVSVSDLVIDVPVAKDGLEMESRIFIAASAYALPGWPYFGEAPFTYHALDMGDVFADIPLTFQMPTTFTSMDLARRLGEALQLHFDTEDIFQEPVTLVANETYFELRAGLTSPRWKGSVVIKIFSDTNLDG